MGNEFKKTICVIGGANIDLCGSSLEPLRNYDSNPGTISVSFGGVGRNIAQILALLDQKVRFVSCFSSDPYGVEMKQDCEALGMDCSDSLVIEDLPSSMYIAILDENRDMKIAMSDMRILRRMSTDVLSSSLSRLSGDDMIIIDANLDMECLKLILEEAPCPVAADPVSVSKAERFKDDIGKISVFKPNQFEAASMNGIVINTEEEAKESLLWFYHQGVKETIISLADRGILLGFEGKAYWLKHRTIEMENATGGGDSFLGAYVSQRLEGQDVLSAAGFAASAAVTTIEHNAVARRTLNEESVRKAIADMDINIREL